ncbi:HD domain-containing phosphohydrolase [Polynucleobacter necessarius]|uniref:HD domain-containing phosphohydrolase n=1 Tax=Polynucleobacter necessarius TaxID=576610 RepID=UPI0038CD28EB
MEWVRLSSGLKLSHEDIPLEARIMSVADVFDALISDRSYKKAGVLKKPHLRLSRIAGLHLIQIKKPCRSKRSDYLK